MNNRDAYVKLYTETFGVSDAVAKTLEYQGITAWDSVGHMNLISAIEKKFDIMMDTDDIIEFSSFQKGMEILTSKYDIMF